MLPNPHPKIAAQFKAQKLPKLFLLWQNIGDDDPKNIQIMALESEANYISVKKFSETVK